MGFDDANYQEPPDKDEYEAYEKAEKRRLSQCSCSEGDFRFCHGKVSTLELQNGALREALDYAYEALKGYGCDCGTDEPGTCGECYLKAFFKEHPSEKPKCGSCGIDAQDHDEDTCKAERTPIEKRICEGCGDPEKFPGNTGFCNDCAKKKFL